MKKKELLDKLVNKLVEYERKHPRLFRWEMERRKEYVRGNADALGVEEFVYEIMSEIWLKSK